VSKLNHDQYLKLTRASTTREEATVDSVVKFADDKDSINSPKSTNSRHTFESAATLRDPRRFIETESVCTLIKEAHKNKSTLELVFDGKELWQAKSTGSHVVVRPEIGIPLNQLLGDSHYRLKLKESRALAVVLGHAILHYCENSWASNNWNKQHVNFFANANGPDLMRPYLATQFDTPAPHLRDSTDSVYSHPSPALLSLGILLLELYLSKPIESLWELADTDDGVEGPLTNWITAEKWLDKLGDDLYEGYRKAIEACLKIDYVDDEESFSLDDERFRKLVYERVVVPLEDELENGFHITPDQLGVW
jgi:hypothetical protein